MEREYITIVLLELVAVKGSFQNLQQASHSFDMGAFPGVKSFCLGVLPGINPRLL